MALRTRRPTGRVSHPLLLIEGAEKSGKTWACAQFSASDKIGTTYWIDLGEGSAKGVKSALAEVAETVLDGLAPGGAR